MGYYNDNTVNPLFLLGSAVTDYQVIRHKLAKSQILIDSARSMLYRAAQALDKCGEQGLELLECHYPLWQVKTHAADIVIDVTNDALQVSGGRGYLTGQVEKFLRDGRAGALMGPTNEVLHKWIGRTLIEVPWLD